MTNEITKIGLAVIRSNRILLVKKRGLDSFILPGGKPEPNEDDLQTLVREIYEELGCRLLSRDLKFAGIFSDVAAGFSHRIVTVRLYIGELLGTPIPRSEIVQLLWFDPQADRDVPLAPSLANSILPSLFSGKGHTYTELVH